MNIRPNVKYLIKKYREQIVTWRTEGPTTASWEQIKIEICQLEKLTLQEQPTGEGIRRAWLRLQTVHTLPTIQTSQTVQTNKPERPMVKPISLDNSAEKLPTVQTLATIQTIQTNEPPSPVNKGFRECPSDEDWALWSDEDKIRYGKPATSPNGNRYLSPLSKFEIDGIHTQARYRAADAGEL